MKQILVVIIAIAFILNTNKLIAQRCGSMEYLHQQLQEDPDMAARRQAIETHTNQFVANYQANSSRAVITIPVVVHVVYNTAAQNISTAQIQSQIDRLNLDFRKLNTDWTNTPAVWKNLVADYEIEFCLAKRDPNGNTTDGIVRKQTSTTSFSTNNNVKRSANGGDNAWPAASYLNLWVCNLSGGVLGYAQFPGGAPATDGVVITYTAFGSTGSAKAPYNKGRTTTHEVGHWLNLYHIWGDDGSACSGSDNVSDTPNQGSENYGCPTFPTVSCNNGPNGDMFMNYMDYSNDACMYMFTQGQRTRSMALFANGGARASLINSLGCQPVTSPPVADFVAATVSSCTGNISFIDKTSNGATSWNWDFGDGTTSTLQNPVHQYSNDGTFTVTLTATNSFGSNTKTRTNYITVNRPAAPSANDVSRCAAGTFSLSTSSTNAIAWLDSAGNKVSSSNPFVTPVLNKTTTYLLQDTIAGQQYHLGKTDNSGSGGYLNSNWALIFDVYTACTLESVYVYANGAGNRTFELRDAGGAVLQSRTLSVPNGGGRVVLNFNLTPGSNYQLGFSTNSSINLYRNNGGGTYPYNDAGGNISIKGNNTEDGTADDYYYYFYDWIIKGSDCISKQRAVTAIVSSNLVPNVVVSNASCGSDNGAALVSVSGGTWPYTFIWSNGSSDSTIEDMPTGIYTITVTDANACSGVATANIRSSANIISSKTSTNVHCFGEATGSAAVHIITGTPPYTFEWSNNASTDSLIENISAGEYFVTITDGNNCEHIDTFNISQASNINIQITTNDVACYGKSSGSAVANALGGNAGFKYEWSTADTGKTISNLKVGTYAITVHDAQNCSSSQSFIINEADSISLFTNSTDITCFGADNGKANVIASGGTGSFNYTWCNGSYTHNTTNLPVGTCAVTVTDENGCNVTDSVVIEQPEPIILVALVSNTNAYIDTVYGGVAPYFFEWSNGDTSQAISNVAPGSYDITVTDNNGCTSSANVVVMDTKINDDNADELHLIVYPNPAHQEITLVFSSRLNTATVLSIRNILGQQLLEKEIQATETKLNLPSLAAGMYLIEVKQNGRQIVKQLLIE